MTKMKKLPISIQTFSKIRDGKHCYVDKTSLIAQLVDSGECYFLSRPRRFGKTLLIDTLRSLFEARKELFVDLAISNSWDWDTPYPVVHLSFAGGILRTKQDFSNKLEELLKENAERLGVTCEYALTDRRCFRELIRKTYEKYSQGVVILVDEYDKPILDNITDEKTAHLMRDNLRDLYSVIKDSDQFLRFSFLTGVSKFSKVSLFSGLNNLQDITLDPRYATICGYTENNIKTAFAEYLPGVDMVALKRWYNGYNFLGEPVYNPYDVLLYLDRKEFKPFWFETGTPTFLIELFKDKKFYIPSLANLSTGENLLNSFDVDFIEVEPILLQTGYLTIKKQYLRGTQTRYQLGFPNQEVQESLTNSILSRFVPDMSRKEQTGDKIFRALMGNDFEQLQSGFSSFFASIPHDWYRKNKLADYEGYYCSVVYGYFTALGLDVIPEDTTNHGRIDMSVFFADRVYIIEFKVNELCQPGRALEQIKASNYAEKYKEHEVWLIGVEFNKDDRNLEVFEWERAGEERKDS